MKTKIGTKPVDHSWFSHFLGFGHADARDFGARVVVVEAFVCSHMDHDVSIILRLALAQVPRWTTGWGAL